MEKQSQSISKIIRGIREDQKMSQEEFGSWVGLAQSAINNIERGRREPNFLMLMKIREEFSIDMNHLFDSSESREINL